jgi:hypothetical protein
MERARAISPEVSGRLCLILTAPGMADRLLARNNAHR